MLESLACDIAKELVDFFDGQYKVKSIDLEEQYENLLNLYIKNTLKNLADQSLKEQQKGLERLALTHEDIVLNTELLKKLPPLANWQCFQNEDFIKKQLQSQTEKIRQFFTDVQLFSVKIQNDLIRVCLQAGLFKKVLPTLAQALDLNEENWSKIYKNLDQHSQISYAPSSLCHLLSTQKVLPRGYPSFKKQNRNLSLR